MILEPKMVSLTDDEESSLCQSQQLMTDDDDIAGLEARQPGGITDREGVTNTGRQST